MSDLRAFLAVLFVAGCHPEVTVGEPCTTGEVACGWRAEDPRRIESRCFMTCAGGQWVAAECLPACGTGRALEAGANGTSCEIPAVRCDKPAIPFPDAGHL